MAIGDPPADDHRFWDQLLPLLEEGRVIPVVGPDVVTIQVEGQTVPLYEHLARRLSALLDLPASGPEDHPTLNEVVCRYIANRGDLENVYPRLKEELGRLGALPPPEPLLKLARITGFKLYISSTFDDFLRRALDQIRHNGAPLTNGLAYALNNGFDDLPDDLRNLKRPAVYQLLGRVSAIQETYAVTDEDVLEFVHTLQMSDQRPKRLFDALSGNYILLLGGGLTPWLARFFLRTVKHKDRLWQVRSRAAFVADRTAVSDPLLLQFLQHYNERTFVYASGGPLQFVDELFQRWTERQAPAAAASPEPPRPSQESMPRHAVFLSYASEDRGIVQSVKAQLDQAGIDTWFDRTELKAGTSWANAIKANIDAASLFIPIISSSVLTDGAREFRVEWEAAIDARKRRRREPDGSPARFIAPLVVDDTKMTTDGVQQYFADVQAVALPGGQLTDEFRATIRQLVRAAQLSS